MSHATHYVHLVPRVGSRYRQWFVKGRALRAETLYRATVGPEAMTPVDVAADFGVPVEAVHEAIRYRAENEELLRREREEEWAEIHARVSNEVRPFASAVRVDP